MISVKKVKIIFLLATFAVEIFTYSVEGEKINEDFYDSANENPNEDNGLNDEEEVGV